jgi:hypothetical protein
MPFRQVPSILGKNPTVVKSKTQTARQKPFQPQQTSDTEQKHGTWQGYVANLQSLTTLPHLFTSPSLGHLSEAG